jgi:hypothetical protein
MENRVYGTSHSPGICGGLKTQTPRLLKAKSRFLFLFALCPSPGERLNENPYTE